MDEQPCLIIIESYTFVDDRTKFRSCLGKWRIFLERDCKQKIFILSNWRPQWKFMITNSFVYEQFYNPMFYQTIFTTIVLSLDLTKSSQVCWFQVTRIIWTSLTGASRLCHKFHVLKMFWSFSLWFYTTGSFYFSFDIWIFYARISSINFRNIFQNSRWYT